MTLSKIAGIRVDTDAVQKLTDRDIPDLRRLSRTHDRKGIEPLDSTAGQAFPDHARKPPYKSLAMCCEAASRPLTRALRRLKRHDLAARLEQPQELPGWPGEWRHYETASAVVSYTLHGDHALRNRREQVRTGNKHPAHVIDIAGYAERALAAFKEHGLPLPLHRDDKGRVRIRLIDLEGRLGETDPEWDHIAVDLDLDGDAALRVVAHELCHQCQYTENPTRTVHSPLYSMAREGGARLAEYLVVPSAGEFITDGYLNMPARPLAAPRHSELEPHSYSAGLFWKYMCEQHGTSDGGFDAYKIALETMRDRQGYYVDDLRRARTRMAGPGQFDSFLRCGKNLLSTETSWGNFLVANWMNGTRHVTDPRFSYQERTDRCFGSHSALVEQLVDLPRINGKKRTILERGSEIPVPPFSASYYQIELGDGAPEQLEVTFKAGAENADPLVQILLLDQANNLRDLLRLDQPEWSRVLPSARLGRIIVIAATREQENSFKLTVEETSGHALVSTTRWNCAVGTSYESAWLRAKPTSWNWISPDLEVNQVDQAGERVKIALNVRNRGDAEARHLRVDFTWKPARMPDPTAQNPLEKVGLELGEWRSIGKAIRDQPLTAGHSHRFGVEWSLPAEAKNGYVIRAEIETADAADSDPDNKVAMGIFPGPTQK